MKVTKAAGIQCVILVLILAAEIVFAGRYCAAYPVEQAADADIQGGAEGNAKNGLSEENAVSGLPDGNGSSIPGLPDKETEYVSELGAPEGIVEPAKIVWEEVPAELTETEFIFGGMHVSVPEESTWEYRERKDKALSVCLSTEENFLKKLCFTHYRIEWENRWELILAAMENFGEDGIEVRWFTFRGDTEGERNFGVWSRTESGIIFYMLVFDEQLYLLEEGEPGSFDFEELCSRGMLREDESGGSISVNLWKQYDYIIRSGKKDSLYLLKEEHSGDDQEKTVVYQGGNFERPVQELSGDVYIEGDINFDGYSDVSVYDYEKKERDHLLWSASEKQFVKAVMPPDRYWDKRINDAYETIWTHDDTCTYADGSKAIETIERLYQWEGVELKEVRSITCEIGVEEITVTLTEAESGTCIASGTFPEKDWQSNPEVRELYGQFYEGYAPEEFYHICHTAPGKEECVPETLVKKLSEALEKGRDEKFLEKQKTGRELSGEEIEKAGEKCAGIAGILNDMEKYEDTIRVKMVQADLDNDGCEDIFAQINSGGRMGLADYVLYQGQEDGTWRETGEGSGELYWSFTAVRWEGKNYICREEVDFEKRIMKGLVLEGYQDGKLAETVSLNLMPGEPEISVLSCQKGYQEMAEKEVQKAPEIFEETEKFHAVMGDAEQETEETCIYFGDIDNDGVRERYEKSVWLPSTTSSISHLVFEIQGDTENAEETEETVMEKAISENCEKRGTPIMLWVDSYRGKNIVNVMYRTDLYDYVMEGYLAEDKEHYSSLYLIEKTSKREVEEVRNWIYHG